MYKLNTQRIRERSWSDLLSQRLANIGAEIIGTVHDEIILQVPEGMAREAAVILKETMIEAWQTYVSKVLIAQSFSLRSSGLLSMKSRY